MACSKSEASDEGHVAYTRSPDNLASRDFSGLLCEERKSENGRASDESKKRALPSVFCTHNASVWWGDGRTRKKRQVAGSGPYLPSPVMLSSWKERPIRSGCEHRKKLAAGDSA